METGSDRVDVLSHNWLLHRCVISVSLPQLCRLQAELTRLRSSVERGEAQRVELQYQLTVSRRDADRASELSRDKRTLTGTRIKHTLQVLRWVTVSIRVPVEMIVRLCRVCVRASS